MAADVEIITQAGRVGLSRDLTLGEDLYVERTIEAGLRKRILGGASSTLLVGQAGCGKTSLLWSLYRWLQRAHLDQEAWFLDAGSLQADEEQSSSTPSTGEILEAVQKCAQEGQSPVLMIDTADVRLHDRDQRNSFASFLLSCLDLDARLVITCRPQESSYLPRDIRAGAPREVDTYDLRELRAAITTHVASYYALANGQ